jgi:hypothetical protein
VLKQISLESFRAFRSEQRVDLRPLTLLYGPNSAGKSSIIKALLALAGSGRRPNAHRIEFQTADVDLGGRLIASHRHNRDQPIRIGLDVRYDGSTRGGQGSPIARQAATHYSVRFDLDVGDQSKDTLALSLRRENDGDFIAMHKPVNFHYSTAGDRLRTDPEEHVALRPLWDFLGVSSGMFESDRRKDPIFEIRHLLPARVLAHAPKNNPWHFDRRISDLSNDERQVESLLSEVSDDFGAMLGRLTYVGPSREPWRRAVEHPTTESVASVGSRGERAIWELARRPDVQERVNQDLVEALDVGYRLGVSSLRDTTIPDLAGVAPEIQTPFLEALDAMTRVSPVDAGFGLSQILPIIIEMHLREQSLICIEQPEIHLHPRLQARFGQVLRNQIAGGSQNQFLIETHSEHLLLRIMRLVREEMLDPECVCVLYVDDHSFDPEHGARARAGESRVIDLRLNARGEFDEPWPGGFFDDRYEELPFFLNDRSGDRLE